jgi:mono/diheme cytochrome c family protein
MPGHDGVHELVAKTVGALALTLALLAAPAAAEEGITPEGIRRGAEIYARNCSPCHGPRLIGEESAFDLRTFPHDQRARFVNSVTRGKNAMPAWGDIIKGADLDALWAYVVAGER